MFRKAYAKLAGLYLAIMMAISLFFSVNVFQLSVEEFSRGFQVGDRPGVVYNALPPVIREQLRLQLDTDREARYQAARQRVLTRLVLTNIVILIGGGFLSYYLARRTLQPIEHAHEAQSRFTADASHELRTPLAAMQSEIEVALMDPKLTLPQAKQRLHSNLEELARMTALSEGLLRLAQLENNDLERAEIAVSTLVETSLERTLPLAEKKNILIVNTVADGLVVSGDAFTLSEALVILLDNAIKYSPEKTEISLRAHRTAKGVAIRVKDHGIGIKATELPFIFDRFYRADNARSAQNQQGYGLGLAIARNIAELHGGKLTATSTPGKGSTFTLLLPA